MIKAEKTGSKMKLEVTGDTQDLICEFNEVLKAMYKVLDKSLVESAPFTTEEILHTMVKRTAAEEDEK